MSKISKVLYHVGKNKDRVNVYIDGKLCVSVRQRTWVGMNLDVGSKISCQELKVLENNFWKKLYGQGSWKKREN